MLALLFNKNSDASKEVKTELHFASKFAKPIAPINLEKVPDDYALEHFIWDKQWIAADNGDFAAQVERIAGELETVLRASRPTVTTPDDPPVISPVQPSKSEANAQLQAALTNKTPLKWNNILSAMRDASDFSATDQAGRTVLHWAAMKDDDEAARIAIAGGVDVSAKSNLGQTALDLAKEKGAKKVTALLKAPINPVVIVKPNPSVTAANEQLQTALSSKGPRKAKDILQAIRGGATDFSLRPTNQAALLYTGPRDKTTVEAARIALAGGADAGVRSDLGQTALELARASGSTKVVAFLNSSATPATSDGKSQKPVPQLSAANQQLQTALKETQSNRASAVVRSIKEGRDRLFATR